MSNYNSIKVYEVSGDTRPLNAISVSIEMPKGTKLEVTETVVKELESIIKQEVVGIKMLSSNVGGGGMMGSGSETNTATIRIRLYPENERLPEYDNADQVKEKLRPYFAKFPGASISADSGCLSKYPPMLSGSW